MAYIYQIINDINQKIYVGKTEYTLEKRFNEHCQDAYKERNEKRPLYAAMRKYGPEHFHIELIEETDNPEEREVYWIEKKQSFKYGYNATIGGEGRKYLDYALIIKTYQQYLNISTVAKLLSINEDSIHDILVANNINIKTSSQIIKDTFGKPVQMLDKMTKEPLQVFSTTRDAAHYLINNDYSHSSLTTTRQHISEVCRNKRKSAFGYGWQFL